MTPSARTTQAIPLRGRCTVPGDKSIAQRALILAALADGHSRVTGIPDAGDCIAATRAIEALGAETARQADGSLHIYPRKFQGDVGEIRTERSATAMRLLCGALAALPVRALLTGDVQLLRRPMGRVVTPLVQMGADIALSTDGCAPIRVAGAQLRGITHLMSIPSAQVKSALLLAGLSAGSATTVIEPVGTRDHTERLLQRMGITVTTALGATGTAITVSPGIPQGVSTQVPGDISGAAFVIAAAAMAPRSDVTIMSIGLNPKRTGMIDVLVRMGARVDIERESVLLDDGVEPVGSLRIRHGELHGIRLDAPESARLIDELPLLAVVATMAQGTTEIRGAGELRHKESDRITGIVNGLRALGADIEELPDGLVVHGGTPLHGGVCDALRDHRLAMALAIAARHAGDRVHIPDFHYSADSFPGFAETMHTLEMAS